MDYFAFAADNARQQFAAYRLPDGRLVDINVSWDSAVKGQSPIAFTLADGKIVQAVKVGSTHEAYREYLAGQTDPRD